ncbi:beta-ketoacyl synthase N-terminal-like domain-containing protein [Streptomyces wuyuanensis]|uniref:beta-ketoacyl synthase N-terminal-like domain-containing protein n=1 Tax=Streptomyces wuyuanensis TaxID=1196353 RepID=UPI00371B9C4A
MTDRFPTANSLRITDWSAVSPFGTGKNAFAEGLRASRTANAAPGGDDTPGMEYRPVPDLDIKAVLGKAGVRFTRETAMAVLAARELLEARDADTAPTAQGLGTVIGTTTGTPQSYMDFTKASLQGAKPYNVPVASAPNMVMNRGASATAIWHHLQGPNSTIAGGRTAGLLALRYAQRLLAHRRAEQVLCGAADEYSPARSWLEYHRGGGASTTLGEGCAMLLLEPAGGDRPQRPALAEVTALTFRVAVAGANTADALTACVQDALTQAGATAGDVWAAAPSGFRDGEQQVETDVLRGLLGGEALAEVSVEPLIGDTSAASAMFGITGLLSAAQDDSQAASRLGVVTAVDPDGAVACGVLRFAATGLDD